MKNKKVWIAVSGCVVVVALVLVCVFVFRDRDRTIEVKTISGTAVVEYEDGMYNLQGKEAKYKYMLELEGKIPNAASEGKFVVLSNKDDYTYDEVALSLYSSDIKDQIDDIEIIFAE